MTIFEFLINGCKEALLLQNQDGSLPAGHNGPYLDAETPVRNTAHWCISFIKAYRLTGDKKFHDAAVKCGDLLLSPEWRPEKTIFYCRMNPKKDFTNGLIGQAWAIEALYSLWELTKKEEYIELAINVFLQHPFNIRYGSWYRLNLNGSTNDFDKTFNHQLWFCYVGVLLMEKNEKIKMQVIQFLDMLKIHFEIYDDGCIRHRGFFLDLRPHEKIKRIIKNLITKKSDKDYLKMKSIGYHSFNMYAFSLIRRKIGSLEFWKTNDFLKALEFCSTKYYDENINVNKYGMPYNVSGFEIAVVKEEFSEIKPKNDIISYWLEKQIRFSQRNGSYLLTGNCADPNTLAARIYEVTRLKNDYLLNF